MNSADSEGLGLSALLYMGAILGALALFATPAYYMTRGEVHENPRFVQQVDPVLNNPMTGDRLAGRFPLARLERQTLVDAETVALLTPKAKKPEPAVRTAARPAHRAAPAGTPVAALQPERSRPSLFPFNMF